MTLKQIKSFIRLNLPNLGRDILDEELELLVNTAKNELCDDVGGFHGYASGTTTADTERYKLPTELVALERVEYDGEVINRCRASGMKYFTIPSSGTITWTVDTEIGL